MENFRTRIDFTDRQAKQYEITDITLSGKTSFGLPYSSITSGPDLTITGETFSNGILPSTYTGTTGSTTYVFGDPRMSIDEGDLVPLTPSNSGNTQFAGPTWAGYDMFTTVDGYTGWTYYSSVTYTIDVLEMADLGSGNYSGNVTSDFIVYSASSLDYTGRTIWACVSGITKTDELIVSKDPTIGYVLTCIDSEGKVAFQPSSGGTTGGTDTYVTGSTIEPSNVIRLTRNDAVNVDTDISSLLSGFTSGDTYTTGTTLDGTTLYFDTTDSLSAYTADLSSLSGGSSGATFWEETGTSSTALKDIKGAHTISSTSTNSMIAGGNSNIIDSSLVSFIGGGVINTISDSSSASGIIGGTGNTITGSSVYSFMGGGQSHTMGPNDVTNSTIIAGSGHSINGSSTGFGDRNGIIGGLGHEISGNTDDNFIGGGRYAYMNSRYSAMVGGTNNILKYNTGISATTLGSGIFGGDTNIIDGSETSTILGGNNNTLTTASDSAILGGNNHTITSSDNAMILGGTSGQLYKKNSAIIGGVSNTVFGESAIVAGGTGNTATANYSVVLGGFDNNIGDWGTLAYGSGNTISQGPYSFVGGADNTMSSGAHGLVIGGFNNTLSTSHNSSIIGGDDNVLSSAGNVLAMMATAFSTINGSSSYGAIIGGFDHVISAGTKSVILGGDNNTIGGSGVIAGGALNTMLGGGIIAGSGGSLIASGAAGGIISSNGGDILAGSDNFIGGSLSALIDGSSNSAIIGGNGNTIDSSDDYNAIMAGSANTITGTVRRSAIIGGFDITATADDTVYVPSLNIGTVETGTSVSTLGVSSDGTVISGITKEFFTNPTGVSGAIKGSFYTRITDGAIGESVYMNGSIPDDFSEVISIEALVIPDRDSTLHATLIDCQYGQIDTQYSATTNSSGATLTYVASDFTSIDVSPVFSAITSGDVFGFEINQQGNQTLNVVGLKIKYKAK